MRLLIVRIGGHSDVETVIDWTDAIDFVARLLKLMNMLGIGVEHSLKKIEEQREIQTEPNPLQTLVVYYY